MQILEFYERINQNHENHKILCESYENYEIKRCQFEIIENHEKP